MLGSVAGSPGVRDQTSDYLLTTPSVNFAVIEDAGLLQNSTLFDAEKWRVLGCNKFHTIQSLGQRMKLRPQVISGSGARRKRAYFHRLFRPLSFLPRHHGEELEDPGQLMPFEICLLAQGRVNLILNLTQIGSAYGTV